MTQHHLIGTAPNDSEVNQSQAQIDDLTTAVEALEAPDVVQTEVTWRQEASTDVARIDRHRREPDRPMTAFEFAESIMGNSDDFVRQFKAHTSRPQELSATDQAPHFQQGRDQGLDL